MREKLVDIVTAVCIGLALAALALHGLDALIK